MQLYPIGGQAPNIVNDVPHKAGGHVSDTIRRYSRGACWILALILFVLGSAATVFSWASVITLQRGVATWTALTIILLVLIGRWVGPPAQTREQVKEVKDAVEALRAGLSASADWQRTVATDLLDRAAGIEKRVQGAEVKLDALAGQTRRESGRPVRQRSRRGKGGKTAAADEDPVEAELRGFLAGRLADDPPHGP